MRSLLQENVPHGDKVTPLIQKDSMTHLHGLAGFLKERVPFAKDISLDNAEDSFPSGFTSFSVSLSLTHLIYMRFFKITPL